MTTHGHVIPQTNTRNRGETLWMSLLIFVRFLHEETEDVFRLPNSDVLVSHSLATVKTYSRVSVLLFHSKGPSNFTHTWIFSFLESLSMHLSHECYKSSTVSSVVDLSFNPPIMTWRYTQEMSKTLKISFESQWVQQPACLTLPFNSNYYESTFG
jgi:hypothetical protein